MSLRRRLLLTLAILTVFGLAEALLQGEQTTPQNKNVAPHLVVPPQTPGTPPYPPPQIISGSDIGFRIDRQDRKGPVGTLMVRVNGLWVEAQFDPKGKVVPLGER
jgi:hypothetical protein